MDGHETHFVAASAVRVGIGEKGGVPQVVFEGGLLSAGGLKDIDRLLEFRQVVQALLAALGPERRLVSALVQNGGQYL